MNAAMIMRATHSAPEATEEQQQEQEEEQEEEFMDCDEDIVPFIERKR